MKLISLRTKLLFSTIITCSLIVLVISLVDLFQYRESEKDRIQQEFIRFERSAKKTIREAIWRVDWELVETILENQTSQNISFVEICDDKAIDCLKYGTRDLEPFLDFTIPINYQGGKSKELVKIGDIYLQGHYQTFSGILLHDLPKLIITNIFSVFGIALVLFFIFHRQVVKRLLSLERYTRKIDLQNIDKLDQTVSYPTNKLPDEIDLLANSLNVLIDNTKVEFERRQTLEQQLNQAHKMEALGNLAGGIAHDFNNILAALLGFAELSYIKSKPGSEIHHNLEKIINAGKRAKNLTSQILVFSRRSDSPEEVLTFTKLIEEALNLINLSLPANILLETDLDPSLRVKGDSTSLHQVIMNITTNAIQALGDSSGTIKISLKKTQLEKNQAERIILPPGEYCLLTICDNGPGIPEELKTRIFEPFFTTKPAGKGTGMGLAVVHGIIKSHDGNILLDSTEGEGTCFSIYLPSTDQRELENNTSSDIKHGNGQKIILVDDEPQVLAMGASILKNLSYEVQTYSNPKTALTAFEKKPDLADLVITDFTMPKMNGVEFTKSLKAINQDLPIILWTGYQDNIASGSRDSQLFTTILQKPFEIEDLAKVVSQSLSGPTDDKI